MKSNLRTGSAILTSILFAGALLILLLLLIMAFAAYKQKLRKAMDSDTAGVAGRAMVESEDGKRMITTDGAEPVRVIEQGWLSDFELTSSRKEKVSSASLIGKPYVVSFFFSTCPSVCVKQNEKTKQLYEKFSEKGIRFVSISVDPEIDTPERLTEYAERFGADTQKWLFLTGPMDYISRVGAEVFKIFVTRRGHPEQFIIVDADGKIFGYYNWTDAGQFLSLQQDLAALAEDATLRASDVPKGREVAKPEPPEEDE